MTGTNQGKGEEERKYYHRTKQSDVYAYRNVTTSIKIFFMTAVVIKNFS